MNPEFQRNLYLELSFSRIIAMPVFLLLVFSLTYLADDKSFSETTANTAIGLYILIVLFWGAKQAAENVFDELRNNTWDIQRTSAISPWSLAWGKLLGSTIYNWYGGILCLLVYSISTVEPEFVLLTWFYSLGCGILAQSLSLLVSLFSLRRKQSYGGGLSYLFAIVLLVYFGIMINNVDKFSAEILYWYGNIYSQSIFIVVSLIVACCWSIVGVYRLLAEEFRIRTLPWVWFFFISFLSVYIAGVIVSDAKLPYQEMGGAFILAWFFICIFFSYLLLFIDENNPMLLRKVAWYWQQGKWIRVLQETPCWAISVILAIPTMVVLALISPLDKIEQIYFYPLVIFLLLLRDISILLYFSYAPNRKRAMSLTLLFMVSLYGFFPAIFLAMDINAIAGIILPILNDSLLMAVFAASIQVLVIGFLLFQRWQGRVVENS